MTSIIELTFEYDGNSSVIDAMVASFNKDLSAANDLPISKPMLVKIRQSLLEILKLIESDDPEWNGENVLKIFAILSKMNALSLEHVLEKDEDFDQYFTAYQGVILHAASNQDTNISSTVAYLDYMLWELLSAANDSIASTRNSIFHPLDALKDSYYAARTIFYNPRKSLALIARSAYERPLYTLSSIAFSLIISKGIGTGVSRLGLAAKQSNLIADLSRSVNILDDTKKTADLVDALKKFIPQRKAPLFPGDPSYMSDIPKLLGALQGGGISVQGGRMFQGLSSGVVLSKSAVTDTPRKEPETMPSRAGLFPPAQAVSTLTTLLQCAEKQISEPGQVQLIFNTKAEAEDCQRQLQVEIQSASAAAAAAASAPTDYLIETIDTGNPGETGGGAAGTVAAVQLSYAISLTSDDYNQIMGESDAYDDLEASFVESHLSKN